MTDLDVRVTRVGHGERTALLLPGRGYTVDHPLLWYVAHTLLADGWAVDETRWSPPEQDSSEWALRATRAVITARRPQLVIGKSLGTFGIPAAIEAKIPGLWLTPWVRQPEIRPAAARLGELDVLVAGTADRTWDDTVDSGTARRLLIDGADHALEIADLPADVQVHVRIAAELRRILGALAG